MRSLVFGLVLLVGGVASAQTVPDPRPVDADPSPISVPSSNGIVRVTVPTTAHDGGALVPAEKIEFIYTVVSDQSGREPQRFFIDLQAGPNAGKAVVDVNFGTNYRGATKVDVFAKNAQGTGLVRRGELQFKSLSRPGAPGVVFLPAP